MRYQLAVIGTGPGGYIAAIRGAQLGLKTVAIDKSARFGGTCLNIGCIPSKALLHDSYLAKLGVPSELGKMMTRKEEVVKGLTDGIAFLFKKHKIDTIHAEAAFLAPDRLQVGNEVIEADHIVIATGSEPAGLPFLPFDEERVLSSTGALGLTAVPKKLMVIGGGAIGVELASVWSRLGSEVIVVEMLPEILATMDPAIGRSMQAILQRQGIKFLLGAKVESAQVLKERVTLVVNGKPFEADKVLVAVGRRPFTQGLNLSLAGITPTPKGFIPVNGRFQTAAPAIYAIGDVIEGPMLAHKAMEEGALAAELIAGLHKTLEYISIPNVVYTHPEAASVGLTEPEAKQLRRPLLIGTCPLKGIGRARCNNDTEGFVKVIGDQESGRLLGMHIVAESAGELIGEGVLSLVKKATLEELAHASHAHPALSEAIKEAALVALGRPLN